MKDNRKPNQGPRLLTALERLEDADSALKDAMAILESVSFLSIENAPAAVIHILNSISIEQCVAKALRRYLNGEDFIMSTPDYTEMMDSVKKFISVVRNERVEKVEEK